MSNNSNYNREDKYNFDDSKMNEYEIHMTSDAGYVLTPKYIGYCLSCGRELEEGLYCDSDCRREYYSQIRHDLNGFED